MKFCSYDLRYNGQCLSGRERDRGSTFDRNTQRVRRVPQIEHVFVDRLSGASELVGSSNTREREGKEIGKEMLPARIELATFRL